MPSVIQDLRIRRVRVPLTQTFTTAVRSTNAVVAIVVEAFDSDGLSGFGEATANWQVTGESLAGIEAAVQGPLLEAIRGRSPRELIESRVIERSIFLNPSARSAVDCAVFDLLARQNQRPLATELSSRLSRAGLQPAETVSTDMTLSTGVPGDVVSQARTYADFPVIKIKVDSDPHHVASVAAVRAELGPDTRLRVDANQAWDAETAIAIVRGWEDAGVDIEFVEQPTPARDLRSLALVANSVQTPILADESVWSLADLELLDGFTTKIGVNIKLAKTGGLSGALDLVDAAEQRGMHVLIGCMMESPIGLSSACALAAAIEGTTPQVHDLDAGLWQAPGLVAGGITYSADTIQLGTSDGTGITAVMAGS